MRAVVAVLGGNGFKKTKSDHRNRKKKPAIADEDRFEKARAEALALIKAGSTGLSTYGTPALLNLMNYQKILPAGNFRKNEFNGASRVSGEFIKENYDIMGNACYNCTIACKHIIKSGAFAGYEIPNMKLYGHSARITIIQIWKL